MIREKFTYLFVFSFVLLTSFTALQNKEDNIKLLTTQTDFEVGSSVILKFSSSTTKPVLYCSNSYGSTLVNPIFEDDILQYHIPQHMSNKIGVINWQLLIDDQSISGQINMKPKAEVATMETYIGPPSIEAGETDYSMVVVIPTDSRDNPIPENSLVQVKHQFLDSEQTDQVFTKNLIAFKNISSYKGSGRILVASSAMNTNSKEFTIDVTAAIPTNFNIAYNRPHQYADGNQITTFSTSIIKDRQNNVVSDATYVLFLIEDDKRNILRTSGTTINGVASAKMIHPDKASNWTVKAFVEGMAESNAISLNYKQVVEDFTVNFSEDGRTITVGPIKSFMQQLIPDGLQVKLKVYANETLMESEMKTSHNGFVTFKLKPETINKGIYNIVVEAAGINKSNTQNIW